MSAEEDSSAPAASKLGTKDYWDAHYERELASYGNCGDEGEIWFGTGAEARAINYIKANTTEASAVLDLGCGNGHLLRRLRTIRKSWRGLVGGDYSEPSIRLCEAIEDEEAEEGLERIRYMVVDILALPESSPLSGEQFDIVHDKGTWDAISLSDERAERLISYKRSVISLLRPGSGRFIIVSCNYTTPELEVTFACDEFSFEGPLPEISTKKTSTAFSFGGKAGATFSTAVFRRT